jgi:hypothetical protein
MLVEPWLPHAELASSTDAHFRAALALALWYSASVRTPWAQFGELREWVIDVAGADVKTRTDREAAARAGRDARKLRDRWDLGRQRGHELAGEKRAPGVQCPGRREGLGLGQKPLVAEHLACVAAEDQLHPLAVLDAP